MQIQLQRALLLQQIVYAQCVAEGRHAMFYVCRIAQMYAIR